MIEIPYQFEGEVQYQPYSEIVQRITEFGNYSIIGRDATDEYDMYLIELGNSEKPTLLITASLHGTEWQGTSYSLSFMEQLRDDAFPDKEIRDVLLENFHIAYIPVVNIWGYENTTEYAITQGRLNSTGTNLNRDFGEFNDPESRAVRDVMLNFKPFAYLDIHLIRTNVNRDELLIVGNVQPHTEYLRNIIVDSWEAYSGYDVMRWGHSEGNSGAARWYMRDQPNDYTPHTIAYITEITRPVNENDGFKDPLSDEEIFKFGMASIYLFFKTSIDYYKRYNGVLLDQVETPTGDVIILRDMNGITQSIEEFKEDKTIKTTFSRDDEDAVLSIERSLS